MLSNLALALRARFERTGALADLDEAVSIAQEAVNATPAAHPDRPGWLSNLGNALQSRFKRTGAPADLDASITAKREALNTTPDDHPDRVIWQSNLGNALRSRFERTGALADLDEAIAVGSAAVDATPADHPDRAIWLSNLGNALQARFEQTGALADLDEAISAGRAAVDATPAGHSDRAAMLSNLGAALETRFERTGALADANDAAATHRAAVDATPLDHPDRAIWLANLAATLRNRYERTAAATDLDEAIAAGREACGAVPAGHPDRPAVLSNLGNALLARFDHVGVPADLAEAITAGQEAVNATPGDHPVRAVMLSNLGAALQTRFDRDGARTDLDAAIAAFREAAALGVAPPRVRAKAAREWGRSAATGGQWRDAAAGFEAAVGLLGRVTPRSLVRRDQEHLLAELTGLASEAAACSVHAGQKDRAVELLEQGRGILLSQALDTRTDLTALAEQYPDLAERFRTLRDAVDRADRPVQPAAQPGTFAIRDSAAKRRQETAEAFEQLIGQIRAKPGFARFLRPPLVRDLAASAEDGPIVIINVSRFGSHALILTSAGVLAPVPLADLTPGNVEDHVAGFLSALDERSPSPAAEQRITGVLGWLWDAVTLPVLDRLAITGPPPAGGRWPRLWWCVPGLLSILPLHAAGHHHTRHDAVPETVADRVVSSYTPTIRALMHARRAGGSSQPGRRTRDVLVVTMPRTPGASDLPGADVEAALLRRRFGSRVRGLAGSEATRAAVLGALPQAEWAHFACHGFTDLANPSASCLLLSDHLEQPLTVLDVTRLHLEDAGLAFLSACSTARHGEWLADEAINLASAFQLAGYRHVLGTLWPVSDHDAVELAGELYEALKNAGTIDAAALALHAAVRRLRNRWLRMPSVWASHIHSGA